MKDETKPEPGKAAADHSGAEGTTPAERALAEAAERRARAERESRAASKEINGPKGLEPTRYGDWEKGGIASDF